MSVFISVLKKLFWCFHDFNWYKLVALVGFVLRVVFLPMLIPNIFELIAEIFISKLNMAPWLYEIVIRLILAVVDWLSLSHVFYWISYLTVGNSYEGGSAPIWGSICYTIYYIVYMVIPIVLIQFFQWWVIILTLVLYALLCVGIYVISYFVDSFPDSWIVRMIVHIVCFIILVVIIIVCKIKL